LQSCRRNNSNISARDSAIAFAEEFSGQRGVKILARPASTLYAAGLFD
jgi:hypothetical protein